MNRYSHRFHQQRSEVRVGRRSRTHTCPGEPRCADGLDPGTGDGRHRWPEKKRWTQSARLKRGGGGGANVVRGSARITARGELPRRNSPVVAGRRDGGRETPPPSQLGSEETKNWGSAVAGGGRGVDGQWQMEGRVGRPPCGCGPQVCVGVGPPRRGPRVRDVGATLIFFFPRSCHAAMTS